MAKGDGIEERLIEFAVRVVRLSEALPAAAVGQHIMGQLMRSGTSPATNYAEARSAESSNDFIHKLRIVVKELNETRVWLKIIVRAELKAAERLEEFLGECDQLCKIIGASIRTTRGEISG